MMNDCMIMDDPLDMLKPWRVNKYFYGIIVTYSITFLIGIAGNVIIVVTMTRDKSSRNATSTFLMSLAVADLLLLIICNPLETVMYFLPSWNRDPLCQLTVYVMNLSATASVLNLTAVSFERYVVIVYPIRSRTLCTMTNCRMALFGVWLIACLLSIPVLFTKTSKAMTYCNNATSVSEYDDNVTVDVIPSVNVTIYYCFDVTDGTMPILLSCYQFAIMFVVPLILMTFCYARVIKALWMSTVTMSAMTRLNSSTQFDSRSSISSTLRNTCNVHVTSTSSSTNSFVHRKSPTRFSSNSDEVRQARKQVIKMLILVIVLFLLCWAPYLIYNIMIKIGLPHFSDSMYSLRVTFTLLPFVHSCLNPIIYSFMSSNFRRMMVRTCTHQSCGNVPAACCQNCINHVRLQYRRPSSYKPGMNGDTQRRHPRLRHTGSSTCSDVRTSPITECESMMHESTIVHDTVSFA